MASRPAGSAFDGPRFLQFQVGCRPDNKLQGGVDKRNNDGLGAKPAAGGSQRGDNIHGLLDNGDNFQLISSDGDRHRKRLQHDDRFEPLTLRKLYPLRLQLECSLLRCTIRRLLLPVGDGGGRGQQLIQHQLLDQRPYLLLLGQPQLLVRGGLL